MMHHCALVRRLVLTLSLGVILIGGGTLVAEARSAPPSDPTFSALKIDGSAVEGRLRSLDDEGAVLAIEGKGDQTLAWRDLVKLTRKVASADEDELAAREAWAPFSYPPRSGTLTILPEDDRLAGELQSSDDDHVTVESRWLGALKIPLQNTSALVFQTPSQPKAALEMIDALRDHPKGTDALWLANGDIQQGGFLGWDAKRQRLKFRLQSGPIELEPNGVKAVRLDPALANYPKPAGIFLEAAFVDGSRLGLSGARFDKGELSAKTRFGANLRVAIDHVARLYVRNGSVVYLSDREPDAAQYAEYMIAPQRYRRNRNVEGLPMILAGQTYDRGLGVQSRTLLAYRLDAKVKRFQALVGLDDQAGAQGGVVFRVLADRAEKFKSPPMSYRDAPQFVNVDVSGSRLLILIAEFGPRGEVRDWADWAEARLIAP